MKRLFYSAGIVLTLSLFTSCAQHDSSSPDTSGGVPYNQPGVGVDTTRANPNTTVAPNANSDQTNNNQQINTGDSNYRDRQ